MEDKIEIKNAIIKSARLTIEDHDLLTVWIYLDYGGGMEQGFGGYSLMLGPDFKHRKKSELGPNYAGIFIDKVLRIADVFEWSKLPGKTIRVKCEWGEVLAIGHIVEDEWFNPKEEFKVLKSKTDDQK